MERMDGRTDATDRRARADADGHGRTDGGSEERPGEQVMLFRGRTDARSREREEGTTASGGAAPALPVRGRKRAPPTAAAAGRPQWRSIIE